MEIRAPLEPTPSAPTAVARPRGLLWTTAAMCCLNVSGFALLEPTHDSFWITFCLYLVGAAVGFVAIWYYWRGRNWARRAVLAVSVLSILVPLVVPSSSVVEAVLTWSSALLGAFLIYWLNTAPVVQYFRSQSPGQATAWRWIVGGGVLLLTSAVILLAVLVTLSPTERPVYNDEISEDHRQSLRQLYPEDEHLLGLYSTGITDVTEEGCLFTDRRLVVFRDGRVRRQALYSEIGEISLSRNTGFVGQSELAITRRDEVRLFCALPNANGYPDDAAEFHDRLTQAWRAGDGSRLP